MSVVTPSQMIDIRLKCLELSVQMWCDPSSVQFSVAAQAAAFEKYILEGRGEDK